VRAMTWNLRSLRDDRHTVAAVVESVAPDVLLLQEAPRFPWSRWRAAALARRVGFVVAAGGRRGHGVAVWVRRGLVTGPAEVWPLSHDRGLPRRAVAVVSVVWGGSSVTFVSTHLGLSSRQRTRHVGELVSGLRRMVGSDAAVVLGVDAYEAPDGPVGQSLSSWLADADPRGAATFPAAAPRVRIDQLWCSARVIVARAGVPVLDRTPRASDHLPVVADLLVDHGQVPA
jgi:endonuclease/exonuclease/phosphatase family metal-dependent hydrolase